ncbi:MAG: ribosome small subunit-dependent GTPase A [Clostridia bacterium]|nr:ribosome small subunit-dependent GTPase A [Clostridia bacterium]
MAKKYNGRITKGVGGFYYVDTADGCFECRARGSFRKEGITPLVGDRVEISIDEASGTGAVDFIEERKNVLLRPPVANVTQMAAVISVANPKPNLYLTDKLLASAELAEIEIVLCVNKTDIEDGEDICSVYRDAGFCVIPLSAKEDKNMEILADKLKDNITVFAGNSGVGKSSILNCITGSYEFATGEVSDRVERGRHTTRHTELVPLKQGGYIIDTPGFGTLDFSLLEFENPAGLFREFEPYTDGCRFSDCSHTVEKGCSVLEALKNGKIASTRHESYVRLVDEIKNTGKRR